MLKSRLLASVRPFYAAAGDPPAGDAVEEPNTTGEGNDPPAGEDPPAPVDDNAPGDDAAKIAADAAKAAADAAAAAAPPAETWKDKEIRRKHAQVQEAKRREAG